MRPATPFCRFALSATLPLFFAVAAHPAVEHRAKADGTEMFRSRLLEPPPVGLLSGGEAVEMIQKGSAHSLVKTAGGLRGWVRNADLVEVKLAAGGDHRFKDQEIKADAFNHSAFIFYEKPPLVQVQDLQRSFADEVIETVDREQLEFRNDEN